MKRKTLIFFIFACLLVLTSMPFTVVSASTQASTSDFDCSYSIYPGKDGEYNYYGATNLTTYTETEAIAQNLPEGYSESVIAIDHTKNDRGILLDFSEAKIPKTLLKSITFRVYVGDDGTSNDTYPEVRIYKPMTTGGWVMRYDISKQTDQWVNITLGADGTNVFSGASIGNICKDGYLNKFELAIRSKGTYPVFYIDSVKVELIDDTTPPTITYDGEDTLYFNEGAKPSIDATAYDSEMQQNVDFVWDWSANPSAVNEDGTLNRGTYTVTVKAFDYHGNCASKTFSVVVEDPDTEAPIIHVAVTEMHLPIGTIPMLNPLVTDNTSRFSYTAVWSDGALDSRGRLTEGTHTYTITATDGSGNQTVKTITVWVRAEENLGDNVIDEELIFGSDPDPDPTPNPVPGSEEESFSNSNSEAVGSEDSSEEQEELPKKQLNVWIWMIPFVVVALGGLVLAWCFVRKKK